ncbi:RNA 2',3'-cyclic phosphodiesterase [Halobellus ruber]|uniref:RNA 2',3'-cyclic phosphodiesterase n=1 Tax=Halobellus ruber TaxID=2761102 RepID=A0A7J9SMC9_9EURY|nr:RNA 2',3'-cyclic phosphodiesterase [Halobellus ruber]MBB6647878.1 RNA 2',3'-cyclic phosphodiesterase [Halobellus ruber]
MRLFVSIDLPDRLADAVADAQDRFADAEGLRFVDPKDAHLTLFFLGDTDPERVAEIESALERAVDAADTGPFELRVGGFGVFPALDYISVVWAGVREGAGIAETTRLNGLIERELADLGFEGDDHEFTPHITLARMNDARGKDLVQRVVREADPDLGSFQVDEIRLTESTLTNEGPVYETVRTVTW